LGDYREPRTEIGEPRTVKGRLRRTSLRRLGAWGVRLVFIRSQGGSTNYTNFGATGEAPQARRRRRGAAGAPNFTKGCLDGCRGTARGTLAVRQGSSCCAPTRIAVPPHRQKVRTPGRGTGFESTTDAICTLARHPAWRLLRVRVGQTRETAARRFSQAMIPPAHSGPSQRQSQGSMAIRVGAPFVPTGRRFVSQ